MLTICQRQNLGSGLWAFFQRVDTGATGLRELRAVNILLKPPIPILDALEPRATPALINPHPPYGGLRKSCIAYIYGTPIESYIPR